MPLRGLVFSHLAVFQATVEAIRKQAEIEYGRHALPTLEASFRADFSRRFIIFDDQLDGGFKLTERGLTRIEIRIEPDDDRPGEMVERRCDIGDDQYLEGGYWRPLGAALGTFSRLVGTGEIALWGRWNSLRNPLERIDPQLWPESELFDKVNLKEGTISFSNGERIYAVCAELPAQSSADIEAPASQQRRKQTITADVILSVMRESPVALTRREIAQRAGMQGRSPETGQPFRTALREAKGRLSGEDPAKHALYEKQSPKKPN